MPNERGQDGGHGDRYLVVQCRYRYYILPLYAIVAGFPRVQQPKSAKRSWRQCFRVRTQVEGQHHS